MPTILINHQVIEIALDKHGFSVPENLPKDAYFIFHIKFYQSR